MDDAADPRPGSRSSVPTSRRRPRPSPRTSPASSTAVSRSWRARCRTRTAEYVHAGRLGEHIDVAEGADGARRAALQALSALRHALGSTFAPLERILQVTVYMAAVDGFTAHPRVANGASELLIAVLGDAGRHARRGGRGLLAARRERRAGADRRGGPRLASGGLALARPVSAGNGDRRDGPCVPADPTIPGGGPRTCGWSPARCGERSP